MNNRHSKFKRHAMNIERYSELLSEIDEDDELNVENVLPKIERLEKQRCDHKVEWEDREFTYTAQYPTIYGGSLLHAASVAGCRRVVQALLEAGANIGEKCFRGFTPLHAAAKTGQKEMVKYLLQNEANIEEADNKGCTALHLSAAFGSSETVEVLLAAGARVNGSDKERNSPLHLAVNGHVKKNITKTVKILLNYGADVNAADGVGNSVLHRTILKKDNTVILEGYLTDLEVNAVDEIGKILSLNKERNTEEVMKFLLDHRAVVNVLNHAGDTPLHFAIQYSTLKVIKLLVKQGASVNMRDGRMCTPLYYIGYRHSFSREERFGITKFLLDNGADMNAVGAEGIFTLELIIRRGWMKVAADIIGCFVMRNPEATIPSYLIKYPDFLYYWHNMANKIRDELKKLSTTNFCDGITFRDILCTKDIHKLASYMQNVNACKAWPGRRYNKEFPLHAFDIANQFYKGVKRLELLNAARKSLVKLFYLSSERRKMLPGHIASKIARHLSNRDIKRLNVATENNSSHKREKHKLSNPSGDSAVRRG